MFTACEAFKDHYGSGEVEEITTAESGAVGNESAPVFSGDTTMCENIAVVKVTKAETAGEVAENSGWTTQLESDQSLETVAKQLGTYTTSISVTKKSGEDVVESLSFTLKQTGEKDFTVCSVSYTKADVSEPFSVLGDSIVIDRFNDGSEKVVNAGYYKFRFALGGASGVKALVAGEEASTESTELALEGAYFVEVIEK